MSIESYLIGKEETAYNDFLAFFDTRHDMARAGKGGQGRCKVENIVHSKYLNNIKEFKPFIKDLFASDFAKSADEEARVMMAFAQADADRFKFEGIPEISNTEIIDGPKTELISSFMTDILRDHDSKFVKFIVSKGEEKYPTFVSEALQQRFGHSEDNKLHIHTDYITMYFYRERDGTKLLEGADYQRKVNSLAAYWDEASKDNDKSVDCLELPLKFEINKDLYMPTGYTMGIEFVEKGVGIKNQLVVTFTNNKFNSSAVVVADNSERVITDTYNLLGTSKVSLSVGSLCSYLTTYLKSGNKNKVPLIKNPLSDAIEYFMKTVEDKDKDAVFANIMYNLKRSLDYLQVYVVKYMNIMMEKNPEAVLNEDRGIHFLATGDRLCFMKAVLEDVPAMLQKPGKPHHLIVYTGNAAIKTPPTSDRLLSLMKRIHGKQLRMFDKETRTVVPIASDRKSELILLEKYFIELAYKEKATELYPKAVQTYGDILQAIRSIVWYSYVACLDVYKQYGVDRVLPALSKHISSGSKDDDARFIDQLTLIKQLHPFITNLNNRLQKIGWQKVFTTNFSCPYYDELAKLEMNSQFLENASKMLKSKESIDSGTFLRTLKDVVLNLPDKRIAPDDEMAVDQIGFNKTMIRVVTLAPFYIEDLEKFPFPDPSKMRGEPKGYAPASVAIMNKFNKHKDALNHAKTVKSSKQFKPNISNLNKLLSGKIKDAMKDVDPKFFDEAEKLHELIKNIQKENNKIEVKEKFKGKALAQKKADEFMSVYHRIAQLFLDFDPSFQESYIESQKPQINNFPLLLRVMSYKMNLTNDVYRAIINEVCSDMFDELWTSFNSLPKFVSEFIGNIYSNIGKIIDISNLTSEIRNLEAKIKATQDSTELEKLQKALNAHNIIRNIANYKTRIENDIVPIVNPVLALKQILEGKIIDNNAVMMTQEPEVFMSPMREDEAIKNKPVTEEEVYMDALEDFVEVYTNIVNRHPIVGDSTFGKLKIFLRKSWNLLKGVTTGGGSSMDVEGPAAASSPERAPVLGKRKLVTSPEKPAAVIKRMNMNQSIENIDVNDLEFSWDRLKEVEELLVIKCFLKFMENIKIKKGGEMPPALKKILNSRLSFFSDVKSSNRTKSKSKKPTQEQIQLAVLKMLGRQTV